jgi:hypothetical protein
MPAECPQEAETEWVRWVVHEEGDLPPNVASTAGILRFIQDVR